ncbi:MAG: A/G-specific adenine glycosylase, partial [Bacteroidia bacterium]|nr:A/G-specific adenine glycosylase [Bacteroidia bacterium]
MKLNISQRLIEWYDRHKRDLPWRNTRDPYLIWISEIILQQTRVEQGLPYFEKFIENFPNVKSLAEADEDEVLKLWQGLGYYSRARNLHNASKSVMNDHSGSMPGNYSSLKKLKGVGDYTAAAVASFAYKEAKAVVDGNVIRFISRYFGIEDEVNSAKGIRQISDAASEILDKDDPDIHNQAIMEFGALQCIPSNPDCSSCPFQNNCFAFNNRSVASLPKKKKALKQKHRYFNFFLFRIDDGFFIEKRTDND